MARGRRKGIISVHGKKEREYTRKTSKKVSLLFLGIGRKVEAYLRLYRREN